jgi:hypothetical protein
MISQVHPPETRFGEGSIRPPTERKIQRDAMKYEINIEFPSKAKEEIDFERLRRQIKDKVMKLVNKEEDTLTPTLSRQGRGGEAVMTAYQKFAFEYFDFLAALNPALHFCTKSKKGGVNKPGMKMVIEKWQSGGLKLNLLFKIKKIINSVIRGEIKRVTAKKPLPTAKQEKMAIGFTKYRIIIERIEAEVHKLLCDLGVKTPWFALYKDFVRECYHALKKNYGKNKRLLDEDLGKIIRRWQKEGLQAEILIKLNEKIESILGAPSPSLILLLGNEGRGAPRKL